MSRRGFRLAQNVLRTAPSSGYALVAVHCGEARYCRMCRNSSPKSNTTCVGTYAGGFGRTPYRNSSPSSLGTTEGIATLLRTTGSSAPKRTKHGGGSFAPPRGIRGLGSGAAMITVCPGIGSHKRPSAYAAVPRVAALVVDSLKRISSSIARLPPTVRSASPTSLRSPTPVTSMSTSRGIASLAAEPRPAMQHSNCSRCAPPVSRCPS
jgi:hypothetical protein